MPCAVYGTILNPDGTPYRGQITFIPTQLVSIGGEITSGQHTFVAVDEEGKFSLTLEAGNYETKLETLGASSFVISVPMSGSREINTLISADMTWLIAPTGGAVSIATPSSTGTVKTDVYSVDPVVPLKSSVDAADASLQAQLDSTTATADALATATVAGRVRTDITSADPVVYLKESVDALLAPLHGQTPGPPTARVGLTAVAGTASTFLASDSAPPIDQAIRPHWTAPHTFDGGLSTTATAVPTPSHVPVFLADPDSTARPFGSRTLAQFKQDLGILVTNSPQAKVGLTAKPGTDAAVARADSAPALDTAIVPSWTGKHAFAAGLQTTAALSAVPSHILATDSDPSGAAPQDVRAVAATDFWHAAKPFVVTANLTTTTVAPGVRFYRSGTPLNYPGGTIATPVTTGSFWLALDGSGALAWRTSYNTAANDDLILAAATVTVGAITITQPDKSGGDVRAQNNLADVANVITARQNLGVNPATPNISFSSGSDYQQFLPTGCSYAATTVTVGAGVGTYTATISLSALGAVAGARWDFTLLLPASANPTVQITNLTGAGTVLFQAAGMTGFTQQVVVSVVFTGVNWTLLRGGLADSTLINATPTASAAASYLVTDTDPATGLRQIKSRTLAQTKQDLGIAGGPVVEVLTSNLSVYIAPGGNDTTGDGSSAKPWATLSMALAYLARWQFAPGVQVAVVVAGGSYPMGSVSLIHNHPQASQIQVSCAAHATFVFSGAAGMVLPYGGNFTEITFQGSGDPAGIGLNVLGNPVQLFICFVTGFGNYNVFAHARGSIWGLVYNDSIPNGKVIAVGGGYIEGPPSVWSGATLSPNNTYGVMRFDGSYVGPNS